MIDYTISIGTILQTITLILALIAGWNALKNRVTIFEEILKRHAEQLIDNSKKMAQYENDLRELVGNFQRLVGEFGMFVKLINKDK
jgi:hypothetical protein